MNEKGREEEEKEDEKPVIVKQVEAKSFYFLLVKSTSKHCRRQCEYKRTIKDSSQVNSYTASLCHAIFFG